MEKEKEWKVCQQVRIKMVKEKKVKYKDKVNRAALAAEVARRVINDSDREMAVVLCLDGGLHITAVNIVSVGIVDSAIVHPREVFKPAILSNAVSLVFVHNHPGGGELEPSLADVNITERLIQVGKLIGIPLQDSIIIGDEGKYYAFTDEKPEMWI